MTSTDINSKADGVLYVTETLELEGDILEDDKYLSEDFQDEDQNAFKLWKDPSCSSRYLISHDYGVHAVVVPLVNKLWELASKPDRMFLHLLLSFIVEFATYEDALISRRRWN